MLPNYTEFVADAYRQFFLKSLVMLDFNGISGDYMEFGCCGATTFSTAYHATQINKGASRHLWACDSFQGLPQPTSPFDDHPLWTRGNFSMSQADFVAQCSRNGVPRSVYTTVPGFFSDTLPSLTNPFDVAMAFIDCDMYSSTIDVLNFLKTRLKHGMILAFDDYYCYSPTQPSGERHALEEFNASLPQWSFLPYHSFHWAGASFIVQHA
jgi:O-methyltransferase